MEIYLLAPVVDQRHYEADDNDADDDTDADDDDNDNSVADANEDDYFERGFLSLAASRFFGIYIN